MKCVRDRVEILLDRESQRGACLTALTLDRTSVSSDKQHILTSRTSGLEEDTSGISGISPLEEPSSEPASAIGGVGDSGAVEVIDAQEWDKLKISFDPPTSGVDRDGKGETSYVL